MSLRTKTANGTTNVDAPFLSGNHKVIQYLQNSSHCSPNTSLPGLHKTSSHTHNLFNIEVTPTRTSNPSQHRMRSCSDNDSSPSVIERLSRSDVSLGSSLSDPAGHGSTFSSNTSSSGICSTFSDVGHEEVASTASSDELDFNLGFDQIDGHGNVEIADLNEIDDDDDDSEDHFERVDGKLQRISTPNSADTATIRDAGEANLDARISELEEYLRKSYSCTDLGLMDNAEFDNDETITAERSLHQQRASFLHDSTYTLCPQDRFSAYTDHDDHDEEHMTNGIGLRSNSLGINPLNTKSALLDKAPKKVVRFADVLGLDLESIRYMTPPDQSTNSLIQECIRIKLEQLRLAKSLSCSPSLSPSRLDLPNRSQSPVSPPSKQTYRYNLISKYFTSPPNVIPLIYERQIMLECLYTKDSIAYGTIRVHNCAYDKRVFARVTEDEWQTSHDIQAWHSMNYPNDNTDTFTFEIRLGKYNDPTKVPQQIYFAVCLQAMCQEFWDNNIGWNYFLDVVERR